MAHFDGAPEAPVEAAVTWQDHKSHPQFFGGSATIFGISLKLYTLMMDTPVYQYLILKKRPFLPLSELQKVSPRHSKARKQRNTLPLFFNCILSSCAFGATSLGDWLLLVERNIANPKQTLYTSSWDETDIFALGLFQRRRNDVGWNVHLWGHLVLADFLMEHGVLQSVETTFFRGNRRDAHQWEGGAGSSHSGSRVASC